MKRDIVIPLLLSLCICSCTNVEQIELEKRLDSAESVMIERPDSALEIIRGTHWCGEEKTDARRALLYSMALDKSFIDITSDSLISVARNYYIRYGNDRERFLSEYYYACYLRNCGNLNAALCVMTDCEDLGRSSEDHRHLGIMYGQISEIYESQYDYANTVKYDKLALEQYLVCGDEQLIAHTNHSLGYNLFYMNRDQESIAYLEKALAAYEKFDNTEKKDKVLRLMALNYVHNAKLDSAKYALDRMSGWNTYYEYSVLAELYRQKDDLDKAREYSDMAIAAAKDSTELSFAYNYTYALNMRTGNYRQAAEQMKFSSKVINNRIRISIGKSAASAHRDHLQQLYQQANTTIGLMHQRFWMALSCTVIIAIIIIYAIIHVMRKRRMRINRQYWAKIDDIRQANDQMSETINLQNIETQHLRKLLQRYFDPIDKLAATYYERKDSSSAQASIYREVDRILHSYANDSAIKEHIEYTVNLSRKNIMHIAREEMTQLSEREFDLLLYIYAGFSVVVIALFTDDKPNNIYLRKNRLKNKILKLATPSCRIFIDNLSQQIDNQ